MILGYFVLTLLVKHVTFPGTLIFICTLHVKGVVHKKAGAINLDLGRHFPENGMKTCTREENLMVVLILLWEWQESTPESNEFLFEVKDGFTLAASL